ncbi:MAG: ATP-binding cassette domain-containing protein [Clostridia bacterium]|nr:ATP-binding cassette domain-containing protein [Clostridia bacterium]
MIEIKNLSKRYGNQLAVDNISFTIKDGEVLGFLGPNGAGKSTTMNILTGYLSATTGSVSISGYDVLENPDEAKCHIGYLPEHPPLYPDMTVNEYLSFMFDLKKSKLPKKPHLDEICRLVRIHDVRHRIIKHLSKGYQQRVGIAQALIGNPDVLILDEPTVGLDPKQIIEIRKLITYLGKNHTVILSSHILSEIQAVCERVIIINKGRIIADDKMDNLSKVLCEDNSLITRVKGPDKNVLQLIKTIPGVSDVTLLGKSELGSFEFKIDVAGNNDIRGELFSRLADRNWPLLMLKPNELTLEEVFMKLVDGTADVTQIENITQPATAAEDEKADNTAAINVVNEIMGEVIEQFDHPDENKTEKEDK